MSAPAPSPRRVDLSTLKDVRRELAAVYRKMDSNEIASHEGTRRAYVLKTIHDVILAAEIERRVAQLEEQHGLLTPRMALVAPVDGSQQ